jgi:hypothetical protein
VEHKDRKKKASVISSTAPQRERFNSQEEYEEALAFHKHRTKHHLRASPDQQKSPSPGSASKLALHRISGK